MLKIKWDYEEGAARLFAIENISFVEDLICYAAKQFVLHNPKREGSLYDYAYVFVACDNAFYRVNPDTFKVNEMFAEVFDDGSSQETAS